MATRRERVVLELEDDFSAGMIRAAGATALAKRELKSLSGTSVQTSRDNDTLSRSLRSVGNEVETTTAKARAGTKDIDRYGGRLRLLTEAAVTIGPALIPIGATAIPAIAGLAAGFGVAAGAASVALLAFNGVGDALKSLDAYQLEPTQANLEKMRQSFDAIGPAGAEFARYLNSLEPQLQALQDTARGGLFPGVEDGLNSLLGLLPQVRVIIFNVATEMGRLTSEAGAALSGDGFAAFFDYVENQAAPTLSAFAHTLGNVGQGLASLVVAFGPITGDFTSGMERMSRSFAEWAAGVSQTQGFRDFIAYIRESGPQAVDLLGALGTAFVGIVRAAAPVGQAVLPVLTALARVLGDIANSPLGGPLFTAAAAFLAFNRAISVGSSLIAGYRRSVDGLGTSMGKLGAVGGAVAAMVAVEQAAAAMVRSTDKAAPGIERLTRSLLALQSAQGLQGIAADVGDLSGAIATLSDPGMAQDIGAIYDKVPLIGTAFADIAPGLAGARQEARDAATTIDALDQALAGIVTSGSARDARQTFDQLAQAYGLSADQQADLLKLMPAFQEALAGSANAAELNARATARQGRAAGNTASEIEGMTHAMEEQVSAALSAFDAVTHYAQALDAARKRARESNAGLNASTAAGQKNRDALSQLAQAWNDQGAAVRNNLAKYAAARASLIQVASQMGATRAQAEHYANTLLDIPKFITTRVNAYTKEAQAGIQAILTQLNNIPRTISTTWYVNRVNAINKGGYEPNPDARGASGMTVPGPRHPYGDKVLAYLAPGEEVISNRHGQADRWRSLLKQINANRLAVGGTVARVGSGGSPPFPGLSPSSQLFGINKAFLSIAELAKRLESLTANQIRHLSDDLDKLSKNDLTKLSKALGDVVESEKADLQELKQARSSLVQSVRDLVTGGDLFTVADNNGQVQASGGSQDYQDLVAQHNAMLASQPGSGVTSNLSSMLSEGRERLQLIRKLHRMGVDGQALAYLATQPIEVLQELAGSKSQAHQFESQFNQLQHLGQQVGDFAGNAVYGKQIATQTAELQASRKELQQVNKELKAIHKALEHQRHENKKNSQDNAHHVSRSISGAVGTAARSRR